MNAKVRLGLWIAVLAGLGLLAGCSRSGETSEQANTAAPPANAASAPQVVGLATPPVESADRPTEAAPAPPDRAPAARRLPLPGEAAPTPGSRLPIPKADNADVREAVVAGLFYPDDPKKLAQTVDGLLAEAKDRSPGKVRALVCPHAGYEFSGKTAAIAYKQIAGRAFETVIVLGPSHTAAFQGASVGQTKEYRTPLGPVPVSAAAHRLAQAAPFLVQGQCRIRRPDWWTRSPKDLAPAEVETPQTWEHSLEVQLPFLQRSLKHFSLVPIVCGDVDPADLAKGLEPIVDDKTLLVASSDLSHYQDYETAKLLDSACIRAVCSMDIERAEPQQACGKLPILTVMHLARRKGWKPVLLDYRNSGDTVGDKSHVVGYAAIAFVDDPGAKPGVAAPPKQGAGRSPSPAAAAKAEFSPEHRKYLLELARRSVEAAVRGKSPPRPLPDNVPKELTAKRACFVTLTEHGALRGCIGTILPEEPLYRAVISRAQLAAVADRRFLPVRPAELDDIHIEISVLTVPKELVFDSPEDLMRKLRPEVDGVVLEKGDRQATYLPQVWEQLPDADVFLSLLAKKAGLELYDWKQPGVKIRTYQVEAFEEAEK